MAAPQLFEVIAKVASGQMGVDDVCKLAGLTRVTLPDSDAILDGLEKLVNAAIVAGVEVHEVTGVINKTPVRCILVAQGKINLTKA